VTSARVTDYAVNVAIDAGEFRAPK
jgi:hypothetical protein